MPAAAHVSATQALSEFALGITPDDLSPTFTHRGRLHLTDGVASLLAGWDSHEVRQATEAVGWPDTHGLPLLSSIRLGGIATHALEFDDSMHPATLHPSCVLVPTLLGLSRGERDVSGSELLTAYLVGLEAEARLSDCVGLGHYRSGWHATSTIGVLAGALAGARLLRLSVDETVHALAIAASSASGLRVNIGSAVKPLHAGAAAHDAALSALLARAGSQGDLDALGGTHGFFSTYTDGASADPLLHLSLEGIGEGYLLGLKPYPVCGEVVGAVEAAVELSQEVDVSDVRSLTIRTNEAAHRIMSAESPTTSSQARFSLPFCVTAALTDGALTLETFDRLTFPATERYPLGARINWEVEPSQELNREFGAHVLIETTGGSTMERRIDTALGWRDRELTEEQVADKFIHCAGRGLGDDAVTATLAALGDLANRSASDLHDAMELSW